MKKNDMTPAVILVRSKVDRSAQTVNGVRQICPCETDVEDPGPGHIPTCPFSDPDYVPPNFHEDAARAFEGMRDAFAAELEAIFDTEKKP